MPSDVGSDRGDSGDERAMRPRRSFRDRDLHGRNAVTSARAAEVADPDAAEGMAAGALGSDDPAVAGEAAAVIGEAAARRARPSHD